MNVLCVKLTAKLQHLPKLQPYSSKVRRVPTPVSTWGYFQGHSFASEDDPIRVETCQISDEHNFGKCYNLMVTCLQSELHPA